MITAIRRLFSSTLGKFIALAFIALIGVLFALSDVTGNATFGGIGGANVAKVGKTEIGLGELRDRVRAVYNQARQQQPGLTMAAWASAGVSLPHSAAGQYNYGHHVSFNDLQPGDLLFFYQPIGHVTIYIGNGMMVSAPQTGETVKVIPADTFGSSYTGATRLVG